MGVLRLNGKAYGGGIDVIEVTQAQYNALPESKLSDDILYVISDSVNGSDGYPPLIYSDEEREVGVWRDGKPLYQKTLVFQNAQLGRVDRLPHNISDVDFIFVESWEFKQTSLGSSGVIGFESSSSDYWANLFEIASTTISYRIGSGWGAGDLYVNVRYTKTTDTKGSGKWTTQGTLAQHYSTTERLIGTWIDGKPLYEKTVQVTSIPNNNMTDTAHGISNIDTIVDISGTLHTLASVASNNTWTQIPRIQDNATNANIGIEVNNTNIRLKGRTQNYAEIFDKAYVTIQYTKTTD